MLASVFIIAISTVLLVYWFRYSCLLVLRSHAEAATAEARQAGAAKIERAIREGARLDVLEESLNRDYRLLTYMIGHGAGEKLNGIEDRMLVLDYKLMRMWYRLTRSAVPAQAHSALSEMATVLSILTVRLGREPEPENN